MIPLTKTLVLASNSPRRRQLLADAGFQFRTEVLPTNEDFPPTLPAQEVAGYISLKKAEAFRGLYPDELILTADTVVLAGDEVMGKPTHREEAARMLKKLSGSRHEVVTGISLLSGDTIETVSDTASVYFRTLSDLEISYYIEHYKPYDKAGSYGIQEWIGMTGITRIEGSFYTIMGLPVHTVYQLLKPYFSDSL